MNVTTVLHKYGVSVNDPCCYPLGFMQVVSMFKEVGHEVNVLNYNLWDYDLNEELRGQDWVLFTGFEEFKPLIIRDSQIAREMGIHTVLGGALATYDTYEMQEYLDEVFVGEMGQDLPIDSMPYPDYEGFGIDEYNKRHKLRYMGILASRGCPFSCVFCANVCAYRERNLKSVEAEIDHYRAEYNIEYLIFNDNTLNVSKKRFMQICEMMKPKNILWSGAIRADVMDDEMAKSAHESGCKYFVIGIESFRQERLDRMNKQIKAEQIIQTLDTLHKHKIDYHGNIILGLNGDSVADIIDEVSELPAGYNIFPVLAQPFIGTQVQSSLTASQRMSLNQIFTHYAESKGKAVYPLQ
jgi:radical SAM superfamily enzyme YgiQ (UPF0313 family)